MFFFEFVSFRVYAVVQLVDALRYKPEGRGFDSREGHWLWDRLRL
jgi:hypothetical protein